MKKAVILFFVFNLLNSCSSGKLLLENDLSGTYLAKGKDYSHELLIKKDGLFSYKRKSLEIVSNCEGVWNSIGTNYIVITCNKNSNPIDQIRSDYIGGYSDTIKIINRNKIKLHHIILKRSVPSTDKL